MACTQTPVAAFEVLAKERVRPDAVWLDNAEIDESLDAAHQPIAKKISDARAACDFINEVLYFGGVDFKHQRAVDPQHVGRAARMAAHHMDVVTTSGRATGAAPAIEKIAYMHEAIMRGRPGSAELAIASGVSLENIDGFLPIADCFLVATGISKSFTQLDETKAAQLAQRIHGYGIKQDNTQSQPVHLDGEKKKKRRRTALIRE